MTCSLIQVILTLGRVHVGPGQLGGTHMSSVPTSEPCATAFAHFLLVTGASGAAVPLRFAVLERWFWGLLLLLSQAGPLVLAFYFAKAVPKAFFYRMQTSRKSGFSTCHGAYFGSATSHISDRTDEMRNPTPDTTRRNLDFIDS